MTNVPVINLGLERGFPPLHQVVPREPCIRKGLIEQETVFLILCNLDNVVNCVAQNDLWL